MLIPLETSDLAEKNKKEIAAWEARVKKVQSQHEKYASKGTLGPTNGPREAY